MAADRFAVIDFETSGLSPGGGDRAIEIGIALLEGGVIVDTYQSLMNTSVELSYFIKELTGISQSMVDTAPPSSSVMREACDFIGDSAIVAHNASFDKGFYIAELARIGKSVGSNFLCTMLIGRRLYPYSPNHRLATLATLHSISTEGHHRALSDAVMTAKLLNNIRVDLEELYKNEKINAKFLYRYQKKPKQSVKSKSKRPAKRNRPAKPKRPAEPKKPAEPKAKKTKKGTTHSHPKVAASAAVLQAVFSEPDHLPATK